MSTVHDISIFYFSGTGNSRRIAQWFREFAINSGMSCEIADIACIGKFPFAGEVVDCEARRGGTFCRCSNYNDSHYPPPSAYPFASEGEFDNGKLSGNARKNGVHQDSLIIIISPVHGFNFPKITIDFIHKLPKGKNNIVLMNTRASMKIGNHLTPGLTGVAFMLSSFILRRKGYKIIGQIPFDMPSNWIAVHPAIREKAAQFIFDKNYCLAKKHFDKLCAGQSDFASRKDIVQDILISPIALGYYAVGRFFLAKSYYASYKCTKCNLCVEQCPVKAIELVDARPFWTFKCESCMRCMNNCPTNAIETPHAMWLAAILAAIASISSLSGFVARLIAFSIMLLAFTWVFYWIEHSGLANRIIAKVVSLMSLTHYKFWGRYKSK